MQPYRNKKKKNPITKYDQMIKYMCRYKLTLIVS